MSRKKSNKSLKLNKNNRKIQNEHLIPRAKEVELKVGVF